jgi:prevent-host-death family protein
MEKVGAYEAKTHLSELLERVKNGEQITITKHGVPVAILKPVDKDKYADPKETIKKLRRFRENHNTEGISIREMIEEGRR